MSSITREDYLAWIKSNAGRAAPSGDINRKLTIICDNNGVCLSSPLCMPAKDITKTNSCTLDSISKDLADLVSTSSPTAIAKSIDDFSQLVMTLSKGDGFAVHILVFFCRWKNIFFNATQEQIKEKLIAIVSNENFRGIAIYRNLRSLIGRLDLKKKRVFDSVKECNPESTFDSILKEGIDSLESVDNECIGYHIVLEMVMRRKIEAFEKAREYMAAFVANNCIDLCLYTRFYTLCRIYLPNQFTFWKAARNEMKYTIAPSDFFKQALDAVNAHGRVTLSMLTKTLASNYRPSFTRDQLEEASWNIVEILRNVTDPGVGRMGIIFYCQYKPIGTTKITPPPMVPDNFQEWKVFSNEPKFCFSLRQLQIESTYVAGEVNEAKYDVTGQNKKCSVTIECCSRFNCVCELRFSSLQKLKTHIDSANCESLDALWGSPGAEENFIEFDDFKSFVNTNKIFDCQPEDIIQRKDCLTLCETGIGMYFKNANIVEVFKNSSEFMERMPLEIRGESDDVKCRWYKAAQREVVRRMGLCMFDNPTNFRIVSVLVEATRKIVNVTSLMANDHAYLATREAEFRNAFGELKKKLKNDEKAIGGPLPEYAFKKGTKWGGCVTTMLKNIALLKDEQDKNPSHIEALKSLVLPASKMQSKTAQEMQFVRLMEESDIFPTNVVLKGEVQMGESADDKKWFDDEPISDDEVDEYFTSLASDSDDDDSEPELSVKKIKRDTDTFSFAAPLAKRELSPALPPALVASAKQMENALAKRDKMIVCMAEESATKSEDADGAVIALSTARRGFLVAKRRLGQPPGQSRLEELQNARVVDISHHPNNDTVKAIAGRKTTIVNKDDSRVTLPLVDSLQLLKEKILPPVIDTTTKSRKRQASEDLPALLAPTSESAKTMQTISTQMRKYYDRVFIPISKESATSYTLQVKKTLENKELAWMIEACKAEAKLLEPNEIARTAIKGIKLYHGQWILLKRCSVFVLNSAIHFERTNILANSMVCLQFSMISDTNLKLRAELEFQNDKTVSFIDWKSSTQKLLACNKHSRWSTEQIIQIFEHGFEKRIDSFVMYGDEQIAQELKQAIDRVTPPYDISIFVVLEGDTLRGLSILDELELVPSKTIRLGNNELFFNNYLIITHLAHIGKKLSFEDFKWEASRLIAWMMSVAFGLTKDAFQFIKQYTNESLVALKERDPWETRCTRAWWTYAKLVSRFNCNKDGNLDPLLLERKCRKSKPMDLAYMGNESYSRNTMNFDAFKTIMASDSSLSDSPRVKDVFLGDMGVFCSVCGCAIRERSFEAYPCLANLSEQTLDRCKNNKYQVTRKDPNGIAQDNTNKSIACSITRQWGLHYGHVDCSTMANMTFFFISCLEDPLVEFVNCFCPECYDHYERRINASDLYVVIEMFPRYVADFLLQKDDLLYKNSCDMMRNLHSGLKMKDASPASVNAMNLITLLRSGAALTCFDGMDLKGVNVDLDGVSQDNLARFMLMLAAKPSSNNFDLQRLTADTLIKTKVEMKSFFNLRKQVEKVCFGFNSLTAAKNIKSKTRTDIDPAMEDRANSAVAANTKSSPCCDAHCASCDNILKVDSFLTYPIPQAVNCRSTRCLFVHFCRLCKNGFIGFSFDNEVGEVCNSDYSYFSCFECVSKGVFIHDLAFVPLLANVEDLDRFVASTILQQFDPDKEISRKIVVRVMR